MTKTWYICFIDCCVDMKRSGGFLVVLLRKELLAVLLSEKSKGWGSVYTGLPSVHVHTFIKIHKKLLMVFTCARQD